MTTCTHEEVVKVYSDAGRLPGGGLSRRLVVRCCNCNLESYDLLPKAKIIHDLIGECCQHHVYDSLHTELTVSKMWSTNIFPGMFMIFAYIENITGYEGINSVRVEKYFSKHGVEVVTKYFVCHDGGVTLKEEVPDDVKAYVDSLLLELDYDLTSGQLYKKRMASI